MLFPHHVCPAHYYIHDVGVPYKAAAEGSGSQSRFCGGDVIQLEGKEWKKERKEKKNFSKESCDLYQLLRYWDIYPIIDSVIIMSSSIRLIIPTVLLRGRGGTAPTSAAGPVQRKKGWFGISTERYATAGWEMAPCLMSRKDTIGLLGGWDMAGRRPRPLVVGLKHPSGCYCCWWAFIDRAIFLMGLIPSQGLVWLLIKYGVRNLYAISTVLTDVDARSSMVSEYLPRTWCNNCWASLTRGKNCTSYVF